MDDMNGRTRKWIDDNPIDYGSAPILDSGWGSGFGSGDGHGYGNSYGNGHGYGSGNSYGNGNGNGYGNGYGYGYGSGIKSINGNRVYEIDSTPTIITAISGDTARGYILNTDLTTTHTYIVKGRGYFAHGDTLKDAVEALQDKIFNDMDVDEKIAEFAKRYKNGKNYKGTEFYEWHHILTGSCEQGRRAFIRNRGLDINAEYTVREFIRLCEKDYGGDIIRKLKSHYKK